MIQIVESNVFFILICPGFFSFQEKKSELDLVQKLDFKMNLIQFKPPGELCTARLPYVSPLDGLDLASESTLDTYISGRHLGGDRSVCPREVLLLHPGIVSNTMEKVR